MHVFYRPEQTATNRQCQMSPSARKPALVVADWLERGWVQPEDVHGFEPVSADDLKLAHDAAFVDGVLNGTVRNGFGNRDPEVAASLPYTTGSMLAAARHALTYREAVCSPTSGFHHAGFDEAEGFCSFNALIVTAMKLYAEGRVESVGIIDLDMHYGNGTQDLINRHGLHWIRHHTQGRQFQEPADLGRGGERYFKWLDKALADCRDADLVLFQAGADPHIRDPLGGLLTEQQMALRDHAVFGALSGRPLVWNLAGGYQTDRDGGIAPVLRLHRNTVVACKTVAARRSNDTPTLV
jgi:acetoin utilization deacetylase AcuC-like enzyme